MAGRSVAKNLRAEHLIQPYFVREGRRRKEEIRLFPGIRRFSVDMLLKELEDNLRLGIGKILLFGIPQEKDYRGSSACAEDNIVARAVAKIKREFPELTVMTDLCLCAYTTHGHCGLLKHNSRDIDQEATLKALADAALSQADAGADWIAPSAMAKRQVSFIRRALDKGGKKRVKILGYSAKFASNFYGPFREAAHSSPAFGDRSGYQLGFASSAEALKEIAQDIKEGADMVMVKPALAYLDIIREAKERFRYPLAAYNVSGEYSLVKYGARAGIWEEDKAVFEIITAIRRAGADTIITYHAKDIARWLKRD